MDLHGDATSALDAVTQTSAAITTQSVDSAPEGQEHLLFWVGEWPYLVRLAELREALPSVPRHAALPFSPRWLWGIFPLRTDLVALVDPIPVLFYGPDAARAMDVTHATRPATTSDFGSPEAPRALVVGEGDHLLALLADRIGDICVVAEADQRLPDLTSPSGESPLPRYVAGAYAMAGLERDALALRVALLADDIFAALEERRSYE